MTCEDAERLVLHQHAALIHRLVAPPGCPAPAVFPVEPWRFDPRQSAQQACFLCPGVLDRPLRQLLESVPGAADTPILMRLTFPRDLRASALDDLWRMNVSPASLFPSLEGQARALRMLLRQRH